jgi:formylglycine-generating enzyme required for sulfatase activity
MRGRVCRGGSSFYPAWGARSVGLAFRDGYEPWDRFGDFGFRPAAEAIPALVMHGGSWATSLVMARSAYRGRLMSWHRIRGLGFRPAAGSAPLRARARRSATGPGPGTASGSSAFGPWRRRDEP